MNSEWFEKVIKEQIKTCEDVLIGKAKEYATDDDRLHNFKNAAGMMGCDAKEALSGMMAKHTISIYDMCRNGKDYPIELWNEKITDHINYLLLLKAVVTEEKQMTSEKTIEAYVTYYNDLWNKVQKDPHVKYAPVPGMTLMGNQFGTDENVSKPKFDSENLDQAIQLVREHIKNCTMSGCHSCPHSCLNDMKTMSLGCTQGLLDEYDNVISRLKESPILREECEPITYDKDLIEHTKEIIRSLRACYHDGQDACDGCMYFDGEGDCTTMLKQDACDLLEKYLAKEVPNEST